MTSTRKTAGRIAQKRGDILEQMVQRHAHARGWTVQRIYAPSVVIGGKKRYTGRVVGDLVGCDENGRAILIECKSRQAAKTKANPTGAGFRAPRPSDFERHQIHTLIAWHARGALVLVAWIDGAGLRLDRAIDYFYKETAIL
jgi:hypothetical protein